MNRIFIYLLLGILGLTNYYISQKPVVVYEMITIFHTVALFNVGIISLLFLAVLSLKENKA